VHCGGILSIQSTCAGTNVVFHSVSETSKANSPFFVNKYVDCELLFLMIVLGSLQAIEALTSPLVICVVE
jgi:hypothetical protein